MIGFVPVELEGISPLKAKSFKRSSFNEGSVFGKLLFRENKELRKSMSQRSQCNICETNVTEYRFVNMKRRDHNDMAGAKDLNSYLYSYAL